MERKNLCKVQRSTRKRVGLSSPKREIPHPYYMEGNDMIYSAWKHAAELILDYGLTTHNEC